MEDQQKLAQTEQLGRLIELCGNAIELTRGRKRDPLHIHRVIQALQDFKDKSGDYHICSCGYPHYERYNGISKQLVLQICELKPGLMLNFRYHSEVLWESLVRDLPYFKEGYWQVKMRHFMSKSIAAGGRADEDMVEVLEFDKYAEGVTVRGGNNWLSYSSAPISTRHDCLHNR